MAKKKRPKTTRHISDQDKLRNMMTLNPSLSLKGIQDLLSKEGIEKTINAITCERMRMKKTDPGLKNLSLRKGGWFSRLGTTKSKISRLLCKTPGIKNADVLAVLGITDTKSQRQNISTIRKDLVKNGILKKVAKERFPELTTEQKKMKQQVMRTVNITLSIRRKLYRFRPEDFLDLRATVLAKMDFWIANYDPKKGAELKTHIINMIRFETFNFMRKGVKEATGLKYWQVDKLVSLISLVKRGKTLEEAAAERKIPLEEARELMSIYDAHRSIEQYNKGISADYPE